MWDSKMKKKDKQKMLLIIYFWSYFFWNVIEWINIYYMSSYVELIQRIFSNSKDSKAEALRKLIYLSVNDQNKFSQYVPQIAEQLPKTLTDIED